MHAVQITFTGGLGKRHMLHINCLVPKGSSRRHRGPQAAPTDTHLATYSYSFQQRCPLLCRRLLSAEAGTYWPFRVQQVIQLKQQDSLLASKAAVHCSPALHIKAPALVLALALSSPCNKLVQLARSLIS